MFHLSLIHSLLLPISLFVVQSGATTNGDAPKLTAYTSERGHFSIQLPGKPEESEVELSGSKDRQSQIASGTDQGVYMVSWQDSRQLAANSQQKQLEALKLARDSMAKKFKGELVKEEVVTVGKKIQALRFQMNLPEGRGQMLGVYFFANSRMYQLMAIGTQDFARSQQTTAVLSSFKLTKQ